MHKKKGNLLHHNRHLKSWCWTHPGPHLTLSVTSSGAWHCSDRHIFRASQGVKLLGNSFSAEQYIHNVAISFLYLVTKMGDIWGVRRVVKLKSCLFVGGLFDNYVIYDIYDIHNIWWYGCPENRQDLSYSAPGFKVTQKVIFMPKN